jgi:hypothetical protein
LGARIFFQKFSRLFFLLATFFPARKRAAEVHWVILCVIWQEEFFRDLGKAQQAIFGGHLSFFSIGSRFNSLCDRSIVVGAPPLGETSKKEAIIFTNSRLGHNARHAILD